MTSTLTDYIERQDELLKEAQEALPHQFSQCTYPLGPVRQAVYLCLTCPESKGICSACSIACHTNHEQVELFFKRNFRCDCPTKAIANSCTLHTKLEEENQTNHYGRNFKNQFCRCERPYDAQTEPETMIQCLACEDWFHESCCNLRERPATGDAEAHSERAPDIPDPEKTGGEQDNLEEEDGRSEASSSGLPPPLISGDDYESFVCGSCVLKNPVLKQWAGTPGVAIVTRSTPSDPWRRVDDYENASSTVIDVVHDDVTVPLAAGSKRPLSPSLTDFAPEAKRARASSDDAPKQGRCLAPNLSPIAQRIISRLQCDQDSSLGTIDIFLSEGFRERWCRCSTCLPTLEASNYLLEDEETYEPPEDPDSGLSLEELGMRALERLPRDRAIDGIHAFNGMRDDLIKFLRPFAQEGKTVGETDVRDFFASLTEEAAKKRRG